MRSGDEHSQPGQSGAGGQSMHLGYFRGVENASEIRDLMLARLRHWRDAGLGDPDDVPHSVPSPEPVVSQSTDVLEAAKAVLAEARALRATAER